MIVLMTIPDETRRKVEADQAAAAGLQAAANAAIGAAAGVGAEVVAAGLVTGSYRLKARNPASGVASGMMAWPIDEGEGLWAMGIPANHPSCGYASAQNEGVYPVRAKALAIPVSAAARSFRSPREQSGLVLVSRRKQGKPPLLIEEVLGGRKGAKYVRSIVVHWVLVSSVTAAVGWWEQAVADAVPQMTEAFRAELGKLWPGGGGIN
ncbi:MAG: hypothetical protein WC789_13775 [Lentisphaeria bacterium]